MLMHRPLKMSARRTTCAYLVLCMSLVLAATGCAPTYAPSLAAQQDIASAQTSRARVDLARRADEAGIQSKQVLLYQLQAIHAALLDGVPESASTRIDYAYDVLRTQGVNAANSADPFFVSEEGVRIWKGEPYEQAMALALIAVADMSLGRWGNARAASLESLQRVSADDPDRPRAFLLGRLLAGVANRQLGRAQEAAEHFDVARSVAPWAASLIDELQSGAYESLIVFEVGSAPARIATGSDGTEVAFRDRSPSDDRAVVVHDAGGRALWPSVVDTNVLARDARWTGLDQARRNKSAAGTLLTGGGIAVAASSDDTAAQLAGAGAAVIGAIAKGNARADTRYNDLLAQRVYLVPVRLGREPPRLSLEGSTAWLSLLGLRPRGDGTASVRLVRLPTSSTLDIASQPLYANDVTGSLEQPTLPWVLGGRCVRTPSRTLMGEYHRAGLPESIVFEDLIELYRAEGIALLDGPERSRALGHVLEDGSTLYTPQGGTLGFIRLFGKDHGGYEMRSAFGRALSLRVSSPLSAPRMEVER